MNEDKDTFHQQIVFDNDHRTSNTEPSEIYNDKIEKHAELNNESLITAVIVDNQNYQAAQCTYAENEETLKREQSRSFLWPLIVVLIMLLFSIEFIGFLTTGFVHSPIITSLYSLLFICFSITFISILFKEINGLRQLKKQQFIRTSISDLMLNKRNDDHSSASQLCDKIHQELMYDLPKDIEKQWKNEINNSLSNQEIIQLFDIKVLSKVDEKAVSDIAKYASETMLLVAISPLAFIDMGIVLWRNIKMIDKVSGLYGLKLGYWSRLKLIKQVFRDMLLVGASELMIDLGTQALGADLLGKFSGRMAQGFGAGMLTARLGLNTLKACRPLPFIEQAPQLTHIRRALISQVKKSVLKNK